MKVMLFIHSLLGGGAERVAANLANQWAEKGDDVSVITVAASDTDFYALSPSVRRIGLNLDAASKPGNTARTIRSKIARIVALRRILKTQQPDIALSMMVEANLTLALAGWGLDSIVKVGSERAHPPASPLGRFREFLRWRLYGHLDAIVALTEESARWLRQKTRAKRVVVIPNAAVWPLPQQEPKVPPPTATPPHRLVAVGRLHPVKGYHTLIEAFETIAHRFPSWQLIILGEGPQRDSLQKQITALGLTERVSMPGQVGNLPEWYAACDLFVLSSRYEGFPNALVEAMAHGLPAVSFDCPTGPRDIIEHGVNGLLIEAGNISELRAGLASLMHDRAKLELLSSCCIDVRERFDADRINKRWQDLFQELLQ